MEARQSRRDQTRIPENMHIVKDREAVCMLGVWIGNNIIKESVWALVLEKIDKRLEQWEKGHPTMEG